MNQVKYIESLFGQPYNFQRFDARDIDSICAIPNPLFESLEICSRSELHKLKRKGFNSELGVRLMEKVDSLKSRFHPRLPILLFDDSPQLMAKAIWQHFRPQHQIFIYKGGIKNLLQEAKTVFSKSYNFIVFCGLTGVGKTDLLLELSKRNQQVLNLESIANHQGSSFGNLNQKNQPPQETFLLQLATTLDSFDPNLPIFTESEKISLGKNILPIELFEQLDQGKKVLLTLSKKLRVGRLISEYAAVNDHELARGVKILKFKIGKEKSNEILKNLNRRNYEPVADGLLEYFDNSESYQIPTQEELVATINNSNIADSAEKLLKLLPIIQ